MPSIVIKRARENTSRRGGEYPKKYESDVALLFPAITVQRKQEDAILGGGHDIIEYRKKDFGCIFIISFGYNP